jgi:hypothetical protein
MRCRECGGKKDDHRHVQFGGDASNPVKHESEPADPLEKHEFRPGGFNAWWGKRYRDSNPPTHKDCWDEAIRQAVAVAGNFEEGSYGDWDSGGAAHLIARAIKELQE